MNVDGFRIYTNSYGRRLAIITKVVDFSDKSYFYYGAFDAVYINMSDSHFVKAILKRINPVACNETSYLPLFGTYKLYHNALLFSTKKEQASWLALYL